MTERNTSKPVWQKWFHRVFVAVAAIGLVLGLPFWYQGLTFYLELYGTTVEVIGVFPFWTWVMNFVIVFGLFSFMKIHRWIFDGLSALADTDTRILKILETTTKQSKDMDDRIDILEARNAELENKLEELLSK